MKEIPKIDIPEQHKEFCRVVATLCKQYNLTNFHGTFKPGYNDPWPAKITFGWDSGRHGADVDKIHISSEVWVHTKVDRE